MKLKIAIAILALSTAALAQRGHGGAPSGGGSSHMGAGSMGNSGGMGNSGSMGASQGQGKMNAPDAKRAPSDILQKNTKLSSNLEKLLPAGTTAQQACSGFKNLGQCVAAVHVSHNLGISFDDLKAKLTGDKAESLGKAIGELKPDVNAKAEAKKANKQANEDLSNNS